MARRKPPRKTEPQSEPQLPMFDGPPRESELRVFPHTLRPGHVLRDAVGEGTVVHAPSVYRQGKRVSVKLRMANGEERVVDFAAHEKVAVRRPAEPPTGA